MRSVRSLALALSLVAVGAVGGMSLSSMAVDITQPIWTYYTGTVVPDTTTTVFINAYNASGTTQNVNFIARCIAPTTFKMTPSVGADDRTIPPARGDTVEYNFSGGNACSTGRITLEVIANSNRVIPSAYFKEAFAGGNNAQVSHPVGNWQVVGPQGTDNEALVSIISKADAIKTGVDQANSRLGPAGIGFNTRAFCAEGSVRRDGQGVLQMYVTLFSKTDQTVTINYVTNKGTFTKTQPLQAGVRHTDDANAVLAGAGPPYNGIDVDTSIEVVSPQEVFLACPIYFDRSIGFAGPVNGGHVQDGSHN